MRGAVLLLASLTTTGALAGFFLRDITLDANGARIFGGLTLFGICAMLCLIFAIGALAAAERAGIDRALKNVDGARK